MKNSYLKSDAWMTSHPQLDEAMNKTLRTVLFMSLALALVGGYLLWSLLVQETGTIQLGQTVDISNRDVSRLRVQPQAPEYFPAQFYLAQMVAPSEELPDQF